MMYLCLRVFMNNIKLFDVCAALKEDLHYGHEVEL
jgi:hypothetical protein